VLHRRGLPDRASKFGQLRRASKSIGFALMDQHRFVIWVAVVSATMWVWE
jgi:hypothetical protein